MKITVETNVAAPIEMVWKAYTTPEDIKRWNAASDDWHTISAAVDLREGGTFSSRMEAKDGSAGFDFAGTYTRIIEHELIEYSFGDRAAQAVFTPDPTGVGVRVTFDSDHSFDRAAAWRMAGDPQQLRTLRRMQQEGLRAIRKRRVERRFRPARRWCTTVCARLATLV